MQLAAAIRKRRRTAPKEGTIGKERPTWYVAAKLKITTGGIDVADLGGVPNDSFRLRVPNGIYAVEAKLIDFGGALRVSRVRARLDKSDGHVGGKCAEIPVDFAAISIADLGPARQVLDDDETEELAEAARSCMSTEFCRKLAVSAGGHRFELAVCQSGLGDGSYPVFPLKSRRRVVGLEVEFLRDGHVFRRRENTGQDGDGSFDQMVARMHPPKRGERRHFVLTGEQSVLLVIWQKKNATATQVRHRWSSEGRRGIPDSTLSKLCRAGVLKRSLLRHGNGSSYSLVDPNLEIWHFKQRRRPE